MTRKPFHDLGTVGRLLVIAVFYAWLATQGKFLPILSWGDELPVPYPPVPMFATNLAPQKQYSNLMADALLAGQLHLRVQPDPQLLQLEDPYDPAQNWQYQLHDASLYQGKYYLYWGPTPVLVYFLPIRLLLGGYASEGYAIVLFCFVGLIWSLKLLQFLLARCRLEPPPGKQGLMVLGLGLCNFSPFLLHDPYVYQVAIACGYCFQFAALYWIWSGAWGEEPHRGRLLLGSICQGLALGARFQLILATPLLLLAYAHICRQGQRMFGREGIKTFACLFVPVGVCLALLALYNFARFDSWTEFGTRLQLTGVNMRKWDLFDPRSILPGMHSYLFGPYAISHVFPYVHLYKIAPWSAPPGTTHLAPEVNAGIFMCVPFLAVLVFLPLAFTRTARKERPVLWLALAYFVGTGLALLLFVSFIVPAVVLRYVFDFATFFLVAAFLLWSFMDEKVAPYPWPRRIYRGVTSAAVLYSILVNLAIGIAGDDGVVGVNLGPFEDALRGLFGG
jgi:hypothetical protein